MLGSSVNKLSQQKIIDSKGMERVIPVFQKLGTDIKTADGKLKTFTQTQKVLKDGTIRVSGSMKKMDKNTISLAQNIGRLAKRAILTIPLWLALRRAFTVTISTIKNGIRDIITFDQKLQKLKRNLQGTSDEIAQNFNKARKALTDFSLISGIAVEDLTTAMQRFATTGQNFEDSFAGAIGSAKLATIQFGDVVKTADAFARAFKILIDRSEGAETVATQMNKAYALTDELWKTNAFDVNELGGALERFASVANTMNISIEDAIKLLATLHSGAVINTRAGRLLANSISKMVSRLDELQSTLGIEVNPELDTTSTILLKVIDKFVELRNEGSKFEGIAEASKTLKDIFNIRGKLPIESLIALRDVLEDNLQATGDITKFDSAFKDVIKTTGQLGPVFTNINKEIGKALIRGITDSEDFNEALYKIIIFTNSLIDNFKGFGKILHQVGSAIGIVSGALKKLRLGIPNVFGNLGAIFQAVDRADGVKGFFREYQKALDEGFDNLEDEYIKKVKQFEASTISATNKSLDNVSKKIDVKKLESFINDIKIKKASGKIQVSNDLIRQLENGLQSQLKEQSLEIRVPEDALEVILDARLKELELLGATNSELLEYEQRQRESLEIELDKTKALEQALELERAIKEEKRLQSELGNESIKLFRIAQEQGIDVARQIGDVLSGDADFANFVRRGGQAVETFKKEFQSLFEQQQAKAFFQGETVPGLRTLRGGAGIDIQEDFIRRPVGAFDSRLIQLQRRAEGVFSSTPETQRVTPQVSVPVSISTNVDISRIDEVAKTVESNIIKKATQAGSDVNRAIAQAFVNKQVRRI
ncbi:MAG: phage tail tape measure protein [Candidatus Helarchaeota archaeon]